MNDERIRRYKRERQTLRKVMGEIHFDCMFDHINIDIQGREDFDPTNPEEFGVLYYMRPDTWGLEEEYFDACENFEE